MALNFKDVVLRPFNYCIVDEVDSVLIDEAQTPLIISNQLKHVLINILLQLKLLNI